MSAKTSRSEKNSKKSVSIKSNRSANPSVKKGNVSAGNSLKSNSEASQVSRRPDFERQLVFGLKYENGKDYVFIADLIQVSSLIKKWHDDGELPLGGVIPGSEKSVAVLISYIEKKELRTSVSFFVLAELLTIANSLVMEQLTKQLEEHLLVAAKSNIEGCIQALIILNCSPLTHETTTALLHYAASKFLEIARHPSFKDIPLPIYSALIGSCDLNVPSELSMVDASLLWMAFQDDVEKAATTVFAMVRIDYLSRDDVVQIVVRLRMSMFPRTVEKIALLAFNSHHNIRVCLEQTHIARRFVRCGIPSPTRSQHECLMPLSRDLPPIILQRRRDSQKSLDGSHKEESANNYWKELAEQKKEYKRSKKSTRPIQKKKGFFEKIFGDKKSKGDGHKTNSQKESKSKKSGKSKGKVDEQLKAGKISTKSEKKSKKNNKKQ